MTLLMENIFRGSACLTWQGCGKNLVTLSRFMNLNMVKPENFNHLHLVYNFTIPLKSTPPGKNFRKIEISHFPSVAHF